MVGYWSFTGNADDESGNGNNGTVNGATLVADRFGNPNSAYSFDGMDDYIDVPHSSSLQVSSYVTISAWVKMDEATSGIVIVKGNYGHLWDYGLSTSWSYPSYPESGGEFVINEYRDLNDKFNRWHHFAVTVDEINGNLLKIYMDGIEMTGLLCRANDINFTSGNYIRPTSGTLKFGGIPASYSFKGLVDDIRIYNRTLSTSEIDAIYVGEKPIPENPDGLIAYYPFNGNANDESGNNLHATVTNAIPTIDRFGNENSAFEFDGNSGTERYISSHIGQYDTISFSAWFKSDIPTTMYPSVLNYGSSNRLDVSMLGNHPDYISSGDIGKLSAGAAASGAWSPLIVSDSIVADNKWHQMVVCYVPNDSIYFYLDNVNMGSAAYSPNNPADDLLYIGRQINDNAGSVMHQTHFDGSIDDIRIYSKKLEETEITDLYYDGICFEIMYDTIITEIFDTTFVTIYDTITTEVFDSIAVTDTLIIDAVLTGIDSPGNINTLKVYPNPARDHIYINTGDYSRMADYHLKIIDQLGAIVFETNVEEQIYEVNLSTWTGMGLYFLHIVDHVGQTIDIRKIVLQ